MNDLLEVNDVGKIYKEGAIEVLAVDSVSLSLKRGEVLLIMGPSGSGKTTLLSMMGCILHPTSGSIVVNGSNVTGLKEEHLPAVRKKQFGFVFQTFNLFSSLTAAENVEVVLRLKGFDRNRLKKESLSLLEQVGLGKRTGFYPKDLSGGEKQRVAFARALAGEPPIILADEPTANLDSRNGTEILRMLKEMAELSGKAVAVVSHDPKAEAFAHRVVFMEDGRLKD
ncbi:MAG TPA: ABC transporter ATP-binding protein [Syntrophales bacterium]|nr:ABC transporter ATP-binding protein [Syntrophales bacterium]